MTFCTKFATKPLLVLATVCAVMLGLGVPVGLAAALAGPTGEAALLRLTDFCLMVPPLVLALAVSALCGLSPVTAGLALGPLRHGAHPDSERRAKLFTYFQ